METKECCEKCNNNVVMCGGPSCACDCHKSAENKTQSVIVDVNAPVTNDGPIRISTTDTSEKIKAGAKDFAERFEPVMKELAEEDWLERFETTFGKRLSSLGYANDVQPLKAFIEKELERNDDWWKDAQKVIRKSGFEAGRAAERARLRERIESMRAAESADPSTNLGGSAHNEGYNDALQDILNLLSDPQ